MLRELLEEKLKYKIENFTANEWDRIRQKYIDILCEEEYGMPIPLPESLTFEEIPLNYEGKSFCAGTARKTNVIAHMEILGEKFSFPFVTVIPNEKGKHPFFIEIDFGSEIPYKYCPVEEITDNGFGIFHFNYKDITSDDGDFENGLAKIITKGKERVTNATGKIMMWAWAAMRVMDYAETLDCLDLNNAAVCGHSRLGKTALVTGMIDKRFKYVISNNSGCSGAAITYGKVGEQISNITENFPYWFCPNYKKYVDHEKLTFDQHMLIATIAPRIAMVGSAVKDTWADPNYEYLGCAGASKAWENLGLKGFICPDRLPVIDDNFDDGNVCYHLRSDDHYLSRRDWNVYMNSIKKKMN